MSALPGKIQSGWKEIALTGTWIATVAGSFLLPLPEWADDGANQSYTQFIYFTATIIAGFVLIFAFVNKNKKIWLGLSIVTFVLIFVSFFMYSIERESRTLRYLKHDVVIGTVYQPDYRQKLMAIEKVEQHKINPKDILQYSGGNPEFYWTSDSIDHNRWVLIVLLLVSFSLSAIFLIGFVNAFLLYQLSL